mmetsp:Transcript_23003/g.57752  ORF Transcript_23003/g.57752 Transcript_23003/m.57752 type:complete len:212 (-) Transcript_23003:156-791(-)
MSTDLARQLMEPVRSLSPSVNALKPGRAEEIPPRAAHLRPAAPSSRVQEPPPLPACRPSVSNLAFSGAKPHPWGDINMCSLTSDFSGTKATCNAVNRPPSSPHHFSNPRSGPQLDLLAAASDEKGKAAFVRVARLPVHVRPQADVYPHRLAVENYWTNVIDYFWRLLHVTDAGDMHDVNNPMGCARQQHPRCHLVRPLRGTSMPSLGSRLR